MSAVQDRGRSRRLVTPLARRIALAHGVDLAALEGSGPGGRIVAADVRARLQASESRVSTSPRLRVSASPGQVPGPPGLRVSGSSGIPVATATVEFDAGAALGVAAERARLPVGLAAVVVAAVAAVLPAYPELNGRWGGEVAVLRRRVHIAVGEAGDEGMRWALVRDAGDLTARGVARALVDHEVPDGDITFAVVSLGAGVSWQSAAPPLPGTAAALSLGAPARRAVVCGEGLAVRPLALLTLSYDARMLDHCRAAAFLGTLRATLERR